MRKPNASPLDKLLEEYRMKKKGISKVNGQNVGKKEKQQSSVCHCKMCVHALIWKLLGYDAVF